MDVHRGIMASYRVSLLFDTVLFHDTYTEFYATNTSVYGAEVFNGLWYYGDQYYYVFSSVLMGIVYYVIALFSFRAPPKRILWLFSVFLIAMFTPLFREIIAKALWDLFESIGLVHVAKITYY